MAEVVKTSSDPYVGRVSIVRVFSGTLRPDLPLHVSGHLSSFFGGDTGHADHDDDERSGVLSHPFGQHLVTAPALVAGDIGCVSRLTTAETGDTLSSPDDPARAQALVDAGPAAPVAIEAATRSDEDRLSSALTRLAAEDPSLRVEHNAETQQVVLWVLGEAHAEVALDRLSRRYGVTVEIRDLWSRCARRSPVPAGATAGTSSSPAATASTPSATSRSSRCPAGSGFEFLDKVVGGAVPRQFIPSVEKGVIAQMERGLRSGHPLVDLRVTLVDGKSHSVDSSDMAFQSAGALALREAAEAAGITVLEPYDEIAVLVLDDQVGEVMSDVAARRGRPLGTDRVGDDRTLVRAGCRRPRSSATPRTCAPPPTGPAPSPGRSRTTSRCPRSSRTPSAPAPDRFTPRGNVSTTSWRGRLRGPSPRWEAMSANSSTVQAGPAYPSSSRTQLLTSAGRPSRASVRCACEATTLGARRRPCVGRGAGSRGQPAELGAGVLVAVQARPTSTLARAAFGNAPPPATRSPNGVRRRPARPSRSTRSSRCRSATAGMNASVRCHCSGSDQRNSAASRRGARNSSRSSSTSSGGTTAANSLMGGR